MLFEATLLTFLKPVLRSRLRPLAARLAAGGVTANQVTISSLAGSILVGMLLCHCFTHTWLFAIVPVWTIVRTACAAIDGTLAIEFGQKSRLGGFLNEAGDVISDIALLLPFTFVVPSSASWINLAIVLVVLCELIGMAGTMWGSGRRLEGPLGKIDRSIVLSVVATAIAVFGGLPEHARILIPFFCLALAVTVWNRLLALLATPREKDRPR